MGCNQPAGAVFRRAMSIAPYPPLLWVPFSLAGSAAQIFRNSAQANLTRKIGTLGATQVRFVFGLPFAILFLLSGLALTGWTLPGLSAAAVEWTVFGAICQIGATALMLVVMGKRAFGVAYAYIKTEPVVVALFGVLLLGDRLPALAWLAIVIVVAGVLIASVPPGEFGALVGETRMILLGLASGGLFGLSSIAFRGGSLALDGGGYMLRSLVVLVLSLTTQTLLLGLWLAFRDRPAFTGSLREWKSSLGAGLAGASASAMFMTAFSLAPAANSRTLSLVELPLAALVSHRVSGRGLKHHEAVGMAVILGGVALLLFSHS
jgi:drug/metabolite transporter (DMT)-like permease